MTGITDLPAELLSLIGFLVTPADIINLRQTSRHVLTSVDDVFASYFFRHRSHLYTRHSMEVLHEISSRKYLGKGLECVEIHFPCEDLYDLPTANAAQKQFECVESLFPGQQLAILEDNQEDIQATIRLNVFNLLEELLHNFVRAGIIPDLTFHRYDVMRFHGQERSPFGTEALSQMHWLPSNRPSAHRSEVQGDVAARIALEAIARASFPAQSLDLCGWPLEQCDFLTQEVVRSSAWSFEGPTHRALVSALGPNLRSLSTTVKSEDLVKLSTKKRQQPQGIAPEHHPIGQIILSCPNLNKLRVGLCPIVYGPKYNLLNFGEHYGHFLLDWLANCRLETLELITGAFYWDDLKNLVECHKTSLQPLALLDVHLSSWVEWHNCASYLMDELALTHLHLRDNSTWDRMTYHERRMIIITDSVDDKTSGDHDIAGRDDIREMLLMVPHPWKVRGI